MAPATGEFFLKTAIHRRLLSRISVGPLHHWLTGELLQVLLDGL